MRAAAYREFGGPEKIGIEIVDDPHAGPNQVRIRVAAAGVSPADLGLRSGGTPMSARLVLPHVPGVDAAGVVDELGAGVTTASLGDEVFGSVELTHLGGASAEYAVLDSWMTRPSRWSWAEAATAASSIETSTRALDILEVGPGMTVLVEGAAGGVGHVAVQLARARGARVIGTSREANRSFVESLGAESVVAGPGLVERVRALTPTVDRALDAAGAGTLNDLLLLVDGRASAVVTIADFGAAALGVRLTMGSLAGEPDGNHGLAIAAREASFRPRVAGVFPLDRVGDAHAALAIGGVAGKFAVTL